MFTVKNSEDLTDIGAMKYGDALWLQAGPSDVLGAQYGSLVDQKREIIPTLVSCKRNSMFKAHQYGRWIVLNKENPVDTLGQPIQHLDRIILEQEWYFLSSNSPYESNMYKTINNSDEAMKRKVDLFKTVDECTWRVHLIALPGDDKKAEKQRQKLFQEAKVQVLSSQQKRYNKGQFLLSSLYDTLSYNLCDEAFIEKYLSHKQNESFNNEYMYSLYIKLGKNFFQSSYDPSKFLAKIYGKDSLIAKLSFEKFSKNKLHLLKKSDLENENEKIDLVDELHEKYWDCAEKLKVDSKAWFELNSAMVKYTENDRTKKIRAIATLQRWFKKMVYKIFNYKREMRRIDQESKRKIIQREMIRKSILIQEFHHIEKLKKYANIQNMINKRGSMSVSNSINSRTQSFVETSSPIKHLKNLSNKTFITENNSVKPEMQFETSVLTKNYSLSDMNPTTNKNRFIAPRPKTADHIRFKNNPETISSFENKLCKTSDREFGLPKDLFKHTSSGINLKTGVKFLKIMSKNPDIYSDIKASKKDKKKKKKKSQPKPFI